MSSPNRDHLHFARILEHCPPGRYRVHDIAALTGLSYNLLIYLFNRAKHPQIDSPRVGHTSGQPRWVTVTEAPAKRFERYRQQRNVCHSVRVYPAKRLQ